MKVSSHFFTDEPEQRAEEENLRKRFKRPAKSVPVAIKRSAWDLYIGVGVTEALCPLCDTNTIRRDANSGFEGAHVIAQKWFDDGALSVLYIVPSCTMCNNECSSMCLLDFMFVRGGKRLPLLRRILMTIYTAFVAQHQHALSADFRMAHRVLDHLYGSHKWSTGGIQNVVPIFEMARNEQLHALSEKAASLSRQLQDVAAEMQQLAEAEVKPLKYQPY